MLVQSYSSMRGRHFSCFQACRSRQSLLYFEAAMESLSSLASCCSTCPPAYQVLRVPNTWLPNSDRISFSILDVRLFIVARSLQAPICGIRLLEWLAEGMVSTLSRITRPSSRPIHVHTSFWQPPQVYSGGVRPGGVSCGSLARNVAASSAWDAVRSYRLRCGLLHGRFFRLRIFKAMSTPA